MITNHILYITGEQAGMISDCYAMKIHNAAYELSDHSPIEIARAKELEGLEREGRHIVVTPGEYADIRDYEHLMGFSHFTRDADIALDSKLESMQQVAYVPQHAYITTNKVKVDVSQVEFGFVTSVRWSINVVRVRYFNRFVNKPSHKLNTSEKWLSLLRTLANSENTPMSEICFSRVIPDYVVDATYRSLNQMGYLTTNYSVDKG